MSSCPEDDSPAEPPAVSRPAAIAGELSAAVSRRRRRVLVLQVISLIFRYGCKKFPGFLQQTYCVGMQRQSGSNIRIFALFLTKRVMDTGLSLLIQQEFCMRKVVGPFACLCSCENWSVNT